MEPSAPHKEVSESNLEAEGERGSGRAGSTAMPVLTRSEAAVLAVMSSGDRMGLSTLRARSGMSQVEVRSALDGLRAKGLIVRLHTIVESYALRFPGLDVD